GAPGTISCASALTLKLAAMTLVNNFFIIALLGICARDGHCESQIGHPKSHDCLHSATSVVASCSHPLDLVAHSPGFLILFESTAAFLPQFQHATVCRARDQSISER